MHRPLATLSALSLTALSLAASTSGCGSLDPSPPSGGPVCTSMACTDGLDVVLRLAAEDADVGTHRFELMVDGRAVQCELVVATRGDVVDGACGDGIAIHLGARTRTVELPSPVPGSVMIGSEPVPGEYEARIEIFGTPREVRVVHTAPGRTPFDRTATPIYGAFRPNGPGCDPVCQHGEISLP